jgi:hypothetical protein
LTCTLSLDGSGGMTVHLLTINKQGCKSGPSKLSLGLKRSTPGGEGEKMGVRPGHVLMGTHRRTALLDGHATFLRLGCLAVIALTTCARPSWGIGGAVCLSNDNHVYFILKGTVANIGTQITSVALPAGLQGAGASVALLPDRKRTDIITSPGFLRISRLRAGVA